MDEPQDFFFLYKAKLPKEIQIQIVPTKNGIGHKNQMKKAVKSRQDTMLPVNDDQKNLCRVF